MTYLGDFAKDATVRRFFNTVDSAGSPITIGGTATAVVYKSGSPTPISTGVTITEDYDSVIGLHLLAIDMSADAAYTTATDYVAVISVGTADSVSIVGGVLAQWSCENRRVNALKDGIITANTFDAGVLATDADIADAVLDEIVSGHATEGSVGAVLTAIDGNVDATVTNTASIATIVTTGVAIADGTLTAAKFATDAITADKIAANAIDGDALSAGALTDIATAVHAGTIITGTVTIAATSTLIPFSAISPTLTVVDQLVGRVLIFKTDTTTAQLRGQAATITASTTDSISVSSSEAFTTAPANGDTFVVV